MEKANNILLKLLGILLLTAAILKGWQLMTEPVANKDIWSNRAFLFFTVEFELALGIWLLSGLFKRAAWLIVLACFVLFCGVTLYKGLTGADSCGCFGSITVNPWITLFAIDLPAVVLLAIFRPKLEIRQILQILHWLEPMPNMASLGLASVLSFSAIAVSSPVLILNKPKMVTSTYEVLEPETWIGKKLPILEHIDICEQLKNGNWLIMLYHHDCPDCQAAIPKLQKLAKDLQGNEDFLRIALIEMPPYGQDNLCPVDKNSSFVLSKLDTSKDWFVTTPLIFLLAEGDVKFISVEKIPNFGSILSCFIR